MDEILLRARGTITTHRLLTKGGRIIVAVSGGADSVALLHALAALRADFHLRLHIAHLDHGLRSESAEDARFVAGLGTRWDVPTTIERQDVGRLCEQRGWSLEDGARRIRYEFLWRVAKAESADRVALAHTADDQAETVLMRLLRGAGLLGLGAIPVARPFGEDEANAVPLIIRPLLDVWRSEILACLRANGIAYREDASNADIRFLRNRVRQELLPLLERGYNPNIKRSLTQLAEQSRWDYAFLRQAARRQWKRVAKVKAPAHISVSIVALLRQPKAIQHQLIRQAVESVQGHAPQFEFRHWLEVERLLTELRSGAQVDLPGGVRLTRDGEQLRCQCREPSTRSGTAVTSDEAEWRSLG